MQDRSNWRACGQSVLLAFVLVPLQGVPLTHGGQGGHRGRRPNPFHGQMLPTFVVKKSCHFPVIDLPTFRYVDMVSSIATFPAGYIAKGSAPQQLVSLERGLKTGGIMHVYETPAVAGIDGVSLVQRAVADGAFAHPTPNSMWKWKGTTIDRVFCVISGPDDRAVAQGVRDLQAVRR